MHLKSLVRVLVSLFALAALSTPVMAKDQCAAAKSKADCGKKTTCQWNKTACVAKGAAMTGAKPGKAGAKAAAKPAAKKSGKGPAAATAKPAGKGMKGAAKKAAPAPEQPSQEALGTEDDMENVMGEEEDF